MVVAHGAHGWVKEVAMVVGAGTVVAVVVEAINRRSLSRPKNLLEGAVAMVMQILSHWDRQAPTPLMAAVATEAVVQDIQKVEVAAADNHEAVGVEGNAMAADYKCQKKVQKKE